MHSRIYTLVDAVDLDAEGPGYASAEVSCQRHVDETGVLQVYFAGDPNATDVDLSVQGRLSPFAPWIEVATIDVAAEVTAAPWTALELAIPILPQMRVVFLDGGAWAIDAVACTVLLME